MAELRLTYDELAERLGIKPEAARQRAKRRQREGRWRIVVGNDGRAVVHLDEAELTTEPAGRPADDRADVPLDVLQDEAKRAPDHRPDHRDALLAELQGRAERAERKLAVVEAKAEELAAAARREVAAAWETSREVRERLARLEGEAAGVRATATAEVNAAVRTAEETIAAKDALVDELKALLAEARRPWWRRWIG